MTLLVGFVVILLVVQFLFVVREFFRLGSILRDIELSLANLKTNLAIVAAHDDSQERKLRAENSNLRRRLGEAKEDEDIFPARRLPGLHFEYKGGDNVP